MVNVEGSLSADLIAQQNFGAARRGFDPDEVRAFLVKVAAEIVALHQRQAALEDARRDAEYRAAHPSFDEDTLLGAVGDETAHILKSAHEAAGDIKARAEENASRILKEAHQKAEALRAEAETVLARRSDEAEAVAGRIREAARAEAERLVDQSRQQSKAIRAQAEAERNAMIEGAQVTRDKILSALSKKRNMAVAQVEALRAGRERLLESYQVVRETLEEATYELARAEAEARAAADAVRHRPLALDEADGLEDDGEPTNPTLPIIQKRLRAAAPDPTVPPSPARRAAQAATPVPSRGAAPVTTPKAPGAVPAAVDEARVEQPTTASSATPGAADVAPAPGGPPSPRTGQPSRQTGQPSRPSGQPTADAASPAQPPPPQPPTTPSATGPASSGPAPAASPSSSPAGAGPASSGPSPAGPGPSGPTPAASPQDQGGSADSGDASSGSTPAGAVAQGSSAADLAEPSGTRTDRAAASVGEGGPAVPAAASEVTLNGVPGSAESAAPPSGAVDSLFARIRADRERAVSHARDVLSDDTPKDDRPVPDGDEALLQRRDEAVGPIEANLTRRLKRALQDDQNDLLDRLRGLRTSQKAAAVVLPDRDTHTARFRDVGQPFLNEAFTAGVAFTASLLPGVRASEGFGGLDHFADDLADAIVEPLRRRLESVLVSGEGDDPVVIAEAVGAAYREWKTKRVEVVAADHAASAFAAGAYNATPSGTPLRWLVDDPDGPCPDCDDNVLAGDQPKGEPFPTGQRHPPAHPGCRCLLVPGPG